MDLRGNGRGLPDGARGDVASTSRARKRWSWQGAERLDERVLLSHAVDIGGVTRFIPPSVRASLPPTINTVAPKVESASAVPRLGQFVVTFLNDTAGLNQATLADPANYSIARGTAHVFGKMGLVVPSTTQPLAITGVLVAPPSTSSGTQTVFLQVNGGQRLQTGNYVLTVRSGGIRDLAGRPLDGEFVGSAKNLPSGDGVPGGDFVANIPISVGGLTVFKAVPQGPFFFFGFRPFPRDHHAAIRHDQPPFRF
jgi:hypothetical protein